jgi:1-acyl-sn-glycerol-3-phosphate acyltransferase
MWLRALLRVPAVFLVSLLAAGTMTVVRPLILVAPRRQLAIRNAAFRWWGRVMCRIMGLRVEVEGETPTGRFFLVANHVSYVDVILLASQVPAAFVAKISLARWPLLGWMFLAADTIFIDRARKRDLLRVLDRVRGCLKRDLGVLIFPEGTSGKGEEIMRFKSPLLQLATEERQPVHYVTLTYRAPGRRPAHEVVCWWNDTPFLYHLLRLLGLPYFEATVRFGREPVLAGDRKALAEELRSAMTASFTPIV